MGSNGFNGMARLNDCLKLQLRLPTAPQQVVHCVVESKPMILTIQAAAAAAGLNEETIVGNISSKLDPSVFQDINSLASNASLGRLTVLAGEAFHPVGFHCVASRRTARFMPRCAVLYCAVLCHITPMLYRDSTCLAYRSSFTHRVPKL